MDLATLRVSLSVLVDDCWKANHPFAVRRRGRPVMLSDQEVITLFQQL